MLSLVIVQSLPVFEILPYKWKNSFHNWISSSMKVSYGARKDNYLSRCERCFERYMIDGSSPLKDCTICQRKPFLSPVQFAYQQMKDAGIDVVDHYPWISSFARSISLFHRRLKQTKQISFFLPLFEDDEKVFDGIASSIPMQTSSICPTRKATFNLNGINIHSSCNLSLHRFFTSSRERCHNSFCCRIRLLKFFWGLNGISLWKFHHILSISRS